ncbi:hypothetical protein TH61_12745 [Rufibacter sp. DG15C]|nr:hypothetical protein TH61_12745 [Rufibacter sp. DG15C]
MNIPIDKRGGCKIINYKFDKELSKDYKGGLFPFFAKTKGICSICDYIIFAEKDKTLYALIIELKRGRNTTTPQLNAAECFVNYIINTTNRIHKTNLNPLIRKISIHEYKLKKRNTVSREINYDSNYHHDFKHDIFLVSSFLK